MNARGSTLIASTLTRCECESVKICDVIHGIATSLLISSLGNDDDALLLLCKNLLEAL